MVVRKTSRRSAGEVKADNTRRRKHAANGNPQAVFRRFVRMLEKLQAAAPAAETVMADRRNPTHD